MNKTTERRQKQEPFTSKTFVRVVLLDYKKARQTGQQSVVIQSALCEIVSWFEDRRSEGLTNKCSANKEVMCGIANSRNRKITNKCSLQKDYMQIRITNE